VQVLEVDPAQRSAAQVAEEIDATLARAPAVQEARVSAPDAASPASEVKDRGREAAMSGSPAFQQLTAQNLEEHRQVHFYLERLTRTLAEIDAGVAEAAGRLSAELGSLIERLTEHFTGEEQGGLYHGVLDLLPSYSGEVRRLSDQHARLLDTLEMARLHSQRCAATELPALRQDLAGFVDVLRAHEEAEDELLRRALEVESRV
jgi:hypothetical protein